MMLNALHAGIRCRDRVLEVDLASGAHVEAAAVGPGIRVVPTLAEAPGATLSSEGDAPIVLTCPVPLPGDQAPERGLLSDPALDELIGPSRSMLLSVIAAGPGLGTRELARRTGLGPRLGQRARPDPASGRPDRHQPGWCPQGPPPDPARLGPATPFSVTGSVRSRT
jgi:hypothetical protein